MSIQHLITRFRHEIGYYSNLVLELDGDSQKYLYGGWTKEDIQKKMSEYNCARQSAVDALVIIHPDTPEVLRQQVLQKYPAIMG